VAEQFADFGQTANMFIELEHGVTFASESGHFLTDPAFERDGAVPAMPPAALTLAGIFALGVRARVTGRTRTFHGTPSSQDSTKSRSGPKKLRLSQANFELSPENPTTPPVGPNAEKLNWIEIKRNA
jgi:hypothetical protein